jgi:hypothetical protein
MDRMPLPPELFFAGTPAHVRAHIEQLHATIANLHTRIAELQSKQAKNSTNSSLPPSSEHPYAKPDRPTPKSLRGCGGSWKIRPGRRHPGIGDQIEDLLDRERLTPKEKEAIRLDLRTCLPKPALAGE